MKAVVRLNLAVLLVDVINTLMMEFEAESRAMGKELKFDSKMRFRMLKEASETLRKRSRDAARDGYLIRDADGFCEDSDWMHEVLLLMVEKIGSDPGKMNEVKSMLQSI